MKNKQLIWLVLVGMMISSCKKIDLIHEKGTALYSGVCWVFVSELRGEMVVYEPMNLRTFDIELEDGDTVIFRFIAHDYSTPCQSGTTIDLISLRKK